MSSNKEKFAMVRQSDVDKMVNQTALRDMQIRAFWAGLEHAEIDRPVKINIVCERFRTGYKNVERIIKSMH